MKRDAWDSDRFEDAVTRTVIALYETALSPDDVGPHWNQVAPAAIGVLRRRGVFIPAPDRLIWDNEIDGVDGVPSVGCVSIGEDRAGGDTIESYCRLDAFRRIDRIPQQLRRPCNGAAYEHITFWPQDNGPMRAAKTYHVLDGAGRTRFAAQQGQRPHQDDYAAELSLSAAMQYTADARHQWTITALTADTSVTLGAYADSVKSLLYARELPMTPSGRKRPILHLVHAHRRRIASGIDIDVRDFLRGSREVVMDGIAYRVAAPQRLIEQMQEAA